MKRFLFAPVLLFASCASDHTPVKAILGAAALDPALEPIKPSAVVVRGQRILRVGFQSQTSIPSNAEKFDAAGKFIIPAPVEIPLGSEISTRQDVRSAVGAGRRVLNGMIVDTEDLDEKLLLKLSAEAVIFVPRLHRLVSQPSQLALAMRNTKKLADARVMIAVNADRDSVREVELLAQAGLDPRQIFEAATRNTAYAARVSQDRGSLQPGLRADLWLLDADPRQSPAALAKPAKIMKDGEWVQ